MRVLLFLRRLDAGGAERQFVQLADGLAEGGHDVHLVTLFPGGSLTDRPGPGVETHALAPSTPGALGRARHVASASRRLREAVRRTAPDVVYSALYVGNALAHRAVAPLGVPLVWGLRNARQELGWRRALAFRYGRAHSSEVAAAISNSFAGREAHEALGFRFRRHEVVPNGIDVERFRPDPDGGARLRTAWGIDEDRPLVGLVGRLTENKDVPTFLAAARLLSASRPDIAFVCVGGGPPDFVEALRTRADELEIGERVLWPGEAGDLAATYSALDALASSSTVEGWPNVVGEAMSCGTPCVVTDVGDSARIVDDRERSVPPRSPGALAAALGRLLDLPRETRRSLGAAGRERIAAEFGVETCRDRTAEVLAAAAGG